MKTILRRSALTLFVTCAFSFASKATITYYFYFTGQYSSYSYVSYTKLTTDNGDQTHTLSCSYPGNNSCCWPFIPVIKRYGVSYSYDAIHDYVMAQISQQNVQGEILYEGKLPVSWSINEKGEGKISIDSDEDVK
ncbi:MAG: hypothetical protein P0Y49_09175 [Candidatus Pedobacter colombiensis]|uniref:Uncharacterized protein n=1 Tax=Candidatus Pedobacter colombiensis TaxID=3121371 RepID=A0AAJ5WCW4_9SPHI|nr:hypothetical protein [Pedobacter sp.]WEK21311.1 MAG: hypothetical protein P0Y49_09175 [Pedobacter sp.]